MKNLPLIVKFLAVLGVLGVVAVAATGFMAIQINMIASRGAQIDATQTKASMAVSSASRALQEQRATLEWMEISTSADQNAQAAAELSSARSKFDQALSTAAGLVPAHASDIAALQQRGDQAFDQTCAKSQQLAVAATSFTANQAAQEEFNQNCAQVFPGLTQDMINLRQILTNEATSQIDNLQNTAASVMWMSLIGVIVAFSLVVTGAFLVIRLYVTNPLAALRNAMERLAQGQWGTEVPDQDRKDEVGQMARTVLRFKETGLAKERSDAVAKQAALEVEAERARTEAAREASAAAQALVVESVADGLERLSTGDLMFRLNTAFSAEYEKLRADFNKAVETLQRTMQQISANTEGVRASAGEITQSSDDLSRRTEQQAASLEETAAALDEITATVRKTSEGATEARSVVNEAKVDAERSGEVVGETVKAMGQIEDSSKKIASIIGVIDEIAFQTNLLALNAGVEAARAGDAGRGFAVVATEVRALAQRSADAAKEIKALINASGAQVNTGVKLVNETGEALTRIVEQVARLNILVTDIASSAQEQATGLAEVNSAVNQMDQVTQQNAAMVEESTAASHALSAEAEELGRLVAQFRIGESVQSAVPPRRPATPRPGGVKSKAKAPVRPATPAAPAGKFVALAKSGADDWDEF